MVAPLATDVNKPTCRNQYKLSRFNIYEIWEGHDFVTNTLTGAIILLEKMKMESLRMQEFCVFDSMEFDTFLDNGIIVNKELDEIGLLRNTYNFCKYHSNEATITIAPTLECNFSCSYCYETRENGRMSENTILSTISFIKSMVIERGITCLNIVWYGGEPLLYPRVVQIISSQIITFCNEHCVKYKSSMITNGYLITPSIIELLIRSEISTVQITLDGDQTTHDCRRKLKNGGSTFNKIVSGIRRLAENKIFVVIRVNIDKTNTNAYQEVLELFPATEYISCYPAIVTVEEVQSIQQKTACFVHEEYEDFYNNLVRTSSSLDSWDSFLCGSSVCNCAAESYNSFVIDYKGNLFKCLNDIGKVQYAMGSVFEPHDSLCISAAKYLGRDPFTEETCLECVYIPLCYGGCVWEYQAKGNHACRAAKYIFLNKLFSYYKKGGE